MRAAVTPDYVSSWSGQVRSLSSSCFQYYQLFSLFSVLRNVTQCHSVFLIRL